MLHLGRFRSAWGFRGLSSTVYSGHFILKFLFGVSSLRFGNLSTKLSHPPPKFINSKYNISENNNTQPNNISCQNSAKISVCYYFLTNPHIDYDNITKQIEEDDKNLYANNAMVKEIILERSQSEQVNKIEYLK